MSEGIMIDSKPLTAEMAKEVLVVLQQVNIAGRSAASYLSLCLSLERIGNGVDVVSLAGGDA